MISKKETVKNLIKEVMGLSNSTEIFLKKCQPQIGLFVFASKCKLLDINEAWEIGLITSIETYDSETVVCLNGSYKYWTHFWAIGIENDRTT